MTTARWYWNNLYSSPLHLLWLDCRWSCKGESCWTLSFSFLLFLVTLQSPRTHILAFMQLPLIMQFAYFFCPRFHLWPVWIYLCTWKKPRAKSLVVLVLVDARLINMLIDLCLCCEDVALLSFLWENAMSIFEFVSKFPTTINSGYLGWCSSRLSLAAFMASLLEHQVAHIESPSISPCKSIIADALLWMTV